MENLKCFGFKNERGGTHLARTMMLKELSLLLSFTDNPDATPVEYAAAMERDNCLGKISGKTRKLTSQHLKSLYALDPSVALFRNLVYFWNRDKPGRPLLALLCAYTRDAVLRLSAPLIQSYEKGSPVFRETLEEFIDKRHPGRFSAATLKSVAQNINSTWTQSGHLNGKVKKIRSQAMATPGSVAYALLLGYLNDFRGPALFSTDYTKLLDCSAESAIELAGQAHQKGWIIFKRVGTVMELLFSNLLTESEVRWIRGQN